MVLDFADGATPAFLSENYLNRFALAAGDIIASANGQNFLDRLYDFDRDGLWGTTGSDDLTQETIDFGIYDREANVERSVDYIALHNINLKKFKVQYKPTGGSFTDIPELDFSSVDNTATDLRVSLATPLSVERIKIIMDTTFVADDEKKIGMIAVGAALFQPSMGLSNFRPRRPESVKEVELADGSIDYAYILHSTTRFEFYRAEMTFKAVGDAERDLFRSLKLRLYPFMCIPEPGNLPNEIFLGRVAPNSFVEPYQTFRQAKAGRQISFTFEEVGKDG